MWPSGFVHCLVRDFVRQVADLNASQAKTGGSFDAKILSCTLWQKCLKPVPKTPTSPRWNRNHTSDRWCNGVASPETPLHWKGLLRKLNKITKPWLTFKVIIISACDIISVLKYFNFRSTRLNIWNTFACMIYSRTVLNYLTACI